MLGCCSASRRKLYRFLRITPTVIYADIAALTIIGDEPAIPATLKKHHRRNTSAQDFLKSRQNIPGHYFLDNQRKRKEKLLHEKRL